MKLTKEQIQQVDKFIAYKDVDYIDLKLEILDHMVSEIEEKMQKNSSFNVAFELVAKKWNKHFVQRTSFIFGMFYSAPKIVMDKAKNIYKPFYISLTVGYILSLLVSNIVKTMHFSAFRFSF